MNLIRPALWTALLMTAACHRSGTRHPAGPPPDPIDAAVIDVAVGDLTVHEQVVGTVQPELQATVSAKVLGRLTEMHAVPGMTVAKGQLLARIETPQLEASLQRAEAALANAASEAKRFRALRDGGSVSQSEIDRVETALEIATAERDQIRAQLDEASVQAPFAGRITRKQRDTGDLVQPGTPICRIEDPTRLRFEMNIAESLASRLSIGQQFRVRIEADQLDLHGTVAEISPAADTGSRTFMVKLDLPQTANLLAGQFGRAFIPRATRPGIVVPPEALLTRGQLSYAAVVGDDHVGRLRIVRCGATRPEGVEILAGLRDGERIICPLPADFASGTPVRAAR